ncbi:MAG: CsgG/HfaB family protein [Elusimicrobiota bacterium]
MRNALIYSIFFILSGSILYAKNIYDDIAKTIISDLKLQEVKNVAIPPIEYLGHEKSRGSKVISERLIASFAREDKIKVVERSLLERILEELKLEHLGITDFKTIKKTGKLSNVDIIISGTMFDTGIEEVELNLRAIDLEKGVVLAVLNRKIK